MTSFEPPPAARTTEAGLAFFDRLEAVEPDFMLGTWRGEGWPSGHPLDGALEAFGWQGKRFDGAEAVHPLLFRARGGGTVALSPARVALGLPLLLRWPALKRSAAVARLFQFCLPLMATRRSQGRLRLLRHRGRTTATLVYDRLPILDVFRCIDDDTVMGLMDLKGMERPFFFLLRRELSRPR